MAFELKEPPRLPVSVFAGGAWMVHSAGKTFAEIKDVPEKIAEVFVRAFERVGHDLLLTGSNFVNYPFHFLGCPIKDDSSDSPALLGTVIESLNEVDTLRIRESPAEPHDAGASSVPNILWPNPSARELLRLRPNGRPLSCAARILGVEAVMTATIEDPEGLLRLLDFSTELTWAVLEPILEHPDILGANLAEPVASGDMISPQSFRRFAAPFLKELVNRIRDKGKYSMIHICGNTSRILQDIVDIGPNCFSLEKKVDLRQAKEVLGGKVCVAGNVSPTGAFLNGRPDEVIAEARDCVRAWGGGGGFILMLGCDFPKTVPLENVLALMSMKK